MPNLTPSSLEAIGRALYGRHWQTELAEALNVADRTVRRYLDGSREMPEWMPDELRKLAATRSGEIQAAIKKHLP